jgi:IclR family acetate operon transcriptional repressor
VNPARQPTDSPKVLERALTVLDRFTEAEREWTIADLASAVALPVSTTYRLVNALEAQGLLRSVGNGRFRLGAAAVSLGHRAAAGFDLGHELHSQLEQVAATTRETALLSVLEPRRPAVLCIDRVEAPQPLRLSLEIGTVVPLHAGATSKALLAFLSDDVLEQVLARPLAKLASGTITDPDALRQELTAIRERGWAASREETNNGAWGVAAPVLSRHHRALAVIGMAAPLTRHSWPPSATPPGSRRAASVPRRRSIPGPGRCRASPGDRRPPPRQT